MDELQTHRAAAKDASHLSFLSTEEARMVKGLAQGHTDV